MYVWGLLEEKMQLYGNISTNQRVNTGKWETAEFYTV